VSKKPAPHLRRDPDEHRPQRSGLAVCGRIVAIGEHVPHDTTERAKTGFPIQNISRPVLVAAKAPIFMTIL
jgi:hypothetical protein